MNRKAHNSLMAYKLKNSSVIRDKQLNIFEQRKTSLNIIKDDQFKSPFRYDRQKLIPHSSRPTLTYNQKNPYITKLPKLSGKKEKQEEEPDQIIDQKRILTVEVPRTKLLQPLFESCFIFSAKTKAGSTGKQQKINQDVVFSSQKMALGMKGFVVCDGHGLYGHVVAAYIKSCLLSTF